jgi:hypothetical protein
MRKHVIAAGLSVLTVTGFAQDDVGRALDAAASAAIKDQMGGAKHALGLFPRFLLDDLDRLGAYPGTLQSGQGARSARYLRCIEIRTEKAGKPGAADKIIQGAVDRLALGSPTEQELAKYISKGLERLKGTSAYRTRVQLSEAQACKR